MAMLPNYKDIVDLIKKGSTLEAQTKILELREAAMSLQEENLGLREQLRALEKKLDLKARIQWEQPYYWLTGGASREGPYCQVCYDKANELIRLQGSRNGHWHCGVCKNRYVDKSYRTPEINRARGDWVV